MRKRPFSGSDRLIQLRFAGIGRFSDHAFIGGVNHREVAIGGDQLAREILGIRPGMPIILCTGFSHAIDREKALGQGITALLDKPVLLEQLKQTLATIFSRPTSAPS